MDDRMNEIVPSDSILTHLPADWGQPHNLECPVCFYNLRGLRDERCPECGHQFTWNRLLALHCSRCGRSLADVGGANCPECNLALRWQEMMDGATTRHTKLYEYSGRPFRAALRACWRLLLPWRFWREIPIELPVVESRLKAFRKWAIIALIFGILSKIILRHVWYQLPLSWVSIAINRFAFEVFVVALQPLLTFLGVRQFRLTLQQFEIRREHYQRCQAFGMFVLIASAAATLASIVISVSSLVLLRTAFLVFWFPTWEISGGIADQLKSLEEMGRLLPQSTPPARSLPIDANIAIWLAYLLMAMKLIVSLAPVLLQVWFWLYVYTALKQYLRLDRGNAWALVVSTQVIAYLILILIPILAQLALYQFYV